MPTRDSKQRFSDRVEHYIRSRPGYPPGILLTLAEECEFTKTKPVADIASGTGIFTKLLLENGNPVFAVEPNTEMRGSAERWLASYPNFQSVAGSAEHTALRGHSVAFVTAAQAAHWFDLRRAREEFLRILQPGGWIVLIWNERKTDSTPFLRDYERLLLNLAVDYKEVRHEKTTSVIGTFFAPTAYREKIFETHQDFDYATLEQRLLSSSYAPLADHSNHAPMLRELRRIFEANAEGRTVRMDYETRMFYAQFA